MEKHITGLFVFCAVALTCVYAQDVKIYDAYFGKPLGDKRDAYLSNIVNGSLLCTVPVRPCRKDEGRRVDGTCTNPKYPSRGATLTPFPRLLPAHFGIGNTLRPAHDGTPLPSARRIRTALLSDGQFRDKYFSSLSPFVHLFSSADNVDSLYALRYAVVSDCCINNQVPNLADPRCIPILVPQDDPFLRRTGIRCMNLTRVETYQDYGCLPNTLPAERYNRNTPLLDLSMIYGFTDLRSRMIRANSSGLLAFRMEGSREVPAGLSPFCFGNEAQNLEVTCYDFGDSLNGNSGPAVVLPSLWFFREHNRLARALSAINPCWDDQRLYEKARQINIAQWQYIFYYEFIAEFIGYKTALAAGIIFDSNDYVNDFDPKSVPGVYIEYMIGTRWFHTYQSSVVDLYREKKYVGSRVIVDDILRSGIYPMNNTEEDVTFGALVQPSAKFDYVLDPEIGNRVYGKFQAACDIGAIDIMRGRDAGLLSYNDYRDFCGMKPAKTFEDFHDTIDNDKIESLSRLYKDVDDVDLMTGIYMERMIPDGFVGPTLLCIMTHNLLLWRHSDKFFFEHGGFPAALTKSQLMEIRKTSIARILCNNAVGVHHIQPHAFLRISPGNDFVSCDKIPALDLQAWKDNKIYVKIYDAYFGKPLGDKRDAYFSNIVNGSLLCTVPVRPCRKDEGRRVDGTCTNPKYPSRGATLTPFPRLLPAQFGIGNTLRSAHDGTPLPSARHIRTALLSDGQFRDKYFSSVGPFVLLFASGDSVDIFYALRYAIVSDCCINNQVPNLADPRCIPILVPQDDPFLRRTGIRCMNLTRVETYQDYGCLPNTLPAERYNRSPPLLDLSIIYGFTNLRSRMIRANSSGLLAFRMEGSREVPAGLSPFCFGNEPQNLEVTCYDFGDSLIGNAGPGLVLTSLWFFREHNRLARALSAINPCWDDQRLYEKARQINIAQWQHIVYYELIAELIGYKTALAAGIIFDSNDYVNDFDPKSVPGVYIEYMIGIRWFHTYQSSVADLYREKKYVGSRSLVDDAYRSGIYPMNNTEEDVTFGALVQPSEKFDYVLDPEIGNRVYGKFQAASDMVAIDIMRGRDAGLLSYNDYRDFCGMKPAKTFEDFHDTIDNDKIESLSRLYKDVDDVDLMTGIYMERMIPDGFVGPTLLCIMTHNLLLWRHSDKFFFEHGGFPAALTKSQLMEIRKTSIARILCNNAVGVHHIQPHAFLRISPGNDFVSCDKIPAIDLQAWKDNKICMEKK
ncbi:uncharacterized protein [Epargyreus clarus]|uniref:uncharacterized protein n=1 Tax=Epargyreus clarus TaxID=520877 RepID=UPI003C2B4346